MVTSPAGARAGVGVEARSGLMRSVRSMTQEGCARPARQGRLEDVQNFLLAVAFRGGTEDAIQQRAAALATKAGAIWSSPGLDRETLDVHRPRAAQSGEYTIDDHPFLATGPMREIFEEFRREVLALDPAVSEEVRKVYVAHKAETDFVDVVPQAGRLRLARNMRLPDINDPRELCRDVTGMGLTTPPSLDRDTPHATGDRKSLR